MYDVAMKLQAVDVAETTSKEEAARQFGVDLTVNGCRLISPTLISPTKNKFVSFRLLPTHVAL